MKYALVFLLGMLLASFGYVWYVEDNTADILAFLKSHQAVVGKTIYLPRK